MYPILAIDFGQKHIGLAFSDSKGLVASPLDVLSITKNRGIEVIISEIASLIQEYKINSLLVGYPQEFDASHKQNTQRIDEFIAKLKNSISLPIDTWDESFSTSSARNMLISLGQHYKKRKSQIDSIAASTFLQEYLNSKNT